MIPHIVKPLVLAGLVLVPATASAWDFRQSQSQAQGQAQSQGQGQANDQTIAPSQSVRHETTFDRYAPTVLAPGLTAAGTGVCLGSVSFGIAGPMAGLSFGMTKVDQGCERRSNAALLFQFGHPGAALILLGGNEDVKKALEEDAKR